MDLQVRARGEIGIAAVGAGRVYRADDRRRGVAAGAGWHWKLETENAAEFEDCAAVGKVATFGTAPPVVILKKKYSFWRALVPLKFPSGPWTIEDPVSFSGPSPLKLARRV
jgi:hypothetical protein